MMPSFEKSVCKEERNLPECTGKPFQKIPAVEILTFCGSILQPRGMNWNQNWVRKG